MDKKYKVILEKIEEDTHGVFDAIVRQKEIIVNEDTLTINWGNWLKKYCKYAGKDYELISISVYELIEEENQAKGRFDCISGSNPDASLIKSKGYKQGYQEAFWEYSVDGQTSPSLKGLGTGFFSRDALDNISDHCCQIFKDCYRRNS